MENRHSIVPLVPIKLDRERFLRLDIAALCEAEDMLSQHWGKKTSVYAALLEAPMSLNDLSIIVLYGLRHEDPTLSLPEVKGMLNHSTFADAYQAVATAWTKATQAAEPGQGETIPADPPVPGSTGAPSGLTDVSILASAPTPSGA